MKVSEPRSSGRSELIARGPGGARELRLLRLRLEPGEQDDLGFDGEEAVVVLLDGAVTFTVDGAAHRAERENPFRQRASAVYLPPGRSLRVDGERSAELLIATAVCDTPGETEFFGPENVVVNARGRGSYGREVHDILVRDAHAKRLLVGETFNPPGHWSSFPPHKHDGEDGEPYLEEVYYYRTDPAQGFGFQGLYAGDGSLDVAHLVRDGDAVLISRGFHPVAAAPGYTLYYFWVLAGERRELALYEDPDHVWLHQSVDEEEPS